MLNVDLTNSTDMIEKVFSVNAPALKITSVGYIALLDCTPATGGKEQPWDLHLLLHFRS